MTDVQTIYVAGPMSGYKNFNYDAFNAAAAALREAGYTVLNPAEFDGGGQDDSFHNYMRKDLAIIIAQADAIVCLQDWETSAGAKNEVTVARAIGIPVWDISEFAPIENNDKADDTWALDHPEAPQADSAPWAFSSLTWPNYSFTSNGPVEINPNVSGTYNTTTASIAFNPVQAYTEAWSDGSPVLEPDEEINAAFWTGFGEGYEEAERDAEQHRVNGIYAEVPEQREPESDTSILLEAENVVNGDRQRDYDHPLDNFRRIATLWSVLFECQACGSPVSVTEEQHALAMILVKIARLVHSPAHRDSQVDIAGYAATIEKLQKERIRRDEKSFEEILAAAAEWERKNFPIIED